MLLRKSFLRELALRGVGRGVVGVEDDRLEPRDLYGNQPLSSVHRSIRYLDRFGSFWFLDETGAAGPHSTAVPRGIVVEAGRMDAR